MKFMGWSLKSNRGKFDSAIEALYRHLNQIGLNATLMKDRRTPVIGLFRIADRAIDFIEFEWWETHYHSDAVHGGGGDFDTPSADFYKSYYRCNYLVKVNVGGLHEKLKAEGIPTKSGLFKKQTTDFRWNGTQLAQALNGDTELKNFFLSQSRPFTVKIEPDSRRKFSRRVRISQTPSHSPKAAFPSAETFEAYNRIARHIRSIADTSL